MKVDVEIVKDFPLPDTSAGRSRGVHVSSIIKCIATEMGILKPEWTEELNLIDVRDMSRIGIAAQLRIHMGLAWEEHYIPLIPEAKKHPGEMYVDGVYMTHDAEDVCVIITVNGKIHEVKCTYKSVKTTGAYTLKALEGRQNFMWVCQMKAYCLGRNTHYADLHALHVCGNYVMPIEPQLAIYHCEFTEEEIEDNWNLLQDYKNMKLLEESNG